MKINGVQRKRLSSIASPARTCLFISLSTVAATIKHPTPAWHVILMFLSSGIRCLTMPCIIADHRAMGGGMFFFDSHEIFKNWFKHGTEVGMQIDLLLLQSELAALAFKN